MNEDKLPRVSRKSAGFFRFLNFFQKLPFQIILFLGLTAGVGLASALIDWLEERNNIDWGVIRRDTLLFVAVLSLGTLATFLLRNRTPLFTPRLSFLMNAFGTGFFAVSYLLGKFLNFFFEEKGNFSEPFFMIGSLVAYIVLFVIYFSFTSIGQPWYILLALVQPVVGIILYSFYSAQLTIVFLSKAALFFIISASIFAVVYGPLMAHVSIPYRKKFPGIGGYKFLRAFVEALLLDGHDDNIEYYFEQYARTDNLEMQYVAITSNKDGRLKGLFLLPNVHFGPFKTCGSAALTEKIYGSLRGIPGLTIFHTMTTHEDNFTTHHQNNEVIRHIKEDLLQMGFEMISGENKSKDRANPAECGSNESRCIFKLKDPDRNGGDYPNSSAEGSKFGSSNFIRIHERDIKILGWVINKTPFLMYTRHPLPTDDIDKKIAAEIKERAVKYGLNEPYLIDCHNCITGDEVSIEPNSKEARQLIEISELFFSHISSSIPSINDTKGEQRNKVGRSLDEVHTSDAEQSPHERDIKQNVAPSNRLLDQMFSKLAFTPEILYGTARDPCQDIPIEWGIGEGGIIVNLFRIGHQETCLIHVDSNNALAGVRPAIINLCENEGFDKSELSTSDTHAVARILSAIGYHPLGSKVSAHELASRIVPLIQKARADLEPVKIYTLKSSHPGYKFWKDVSYFEVIIETIQRAVSVSKFLLTIGVIFPGILALLFTLFWLPYLP